MCKGWRAVGACRWVVGAGDGAGAADQTCMCGSYSVSMSLRLNGVPSTRSLNWPVARFPLATAS